MKIDNNSKTMSVFMADFNGRTRRNRIFKRISNRLAIYVENPERFKSRQKCSKEGI